MRRRMRKRLHESYRLCDGHGAAPAERRNSLAPGSVWPAVYTPGFTSMKMAWTSREPISARRETDRRSAGARCVCRVESVRDGSLRPPMKMIRAGHCGTTSDDRQWVPQRQRGRPGSHSREWRKRGARTPSLEEVPRPARSS